MKNFTFVPLLVFDSVYVSEFILNTSFSSVKLSKTWARPFIKFIM